MVLMYTNYDCAFSKMAFETIIDSFREYTELIGSYIAIVDGNANGVHSILKAVYEMRRSGKRVYMITLVSKDKFCSPVICQLSDHVVLRTITCSQLHHLITEMANAKPKSVADSVYGDILGGIFKASQKEYRVLEHLLAGRSQTEISQLLNISVKTVSAYKVKSIRRHGVRNFNELYMLKQNHHI